MILRLIKISVLLGLLGVSFVFGAFFFAVHNHVIDFSVLDRYNPGAPSILLDDEGAEWARFEIDRRDPVLYSTMPTHLINAFVASEDRNFFSHHGISFKGIARSTLVNIYNGRYVQGASTITQQLVRLLFFDPAKTFRRKIKEQLVALLIEQQYSKEQIMQIYLNHVYFGCGIYGVQAAAQRFWSKNVADLTIDESAVLAAIVRSPGRYCPILCPLSAQRMRNVVLSTMRSMGVISREEYESARAKPLIIKEPVIDDCAPHLKETLRLYLEDLVGKSQLYTGGLKIQTTLNKKMQRYAQQLFEDQVKTLRANQFPHIDGGLITLESKTGAIKVLIGGYSFSASKFNRALQAKRQIGSTIKPLIYATAIGNGMSFADTEIDEPIEMMFGNKLWQPRNVSNRFEGEMTLAYALSHSNNMVAIKLLLEVGYEPIISRARECGIEGIINPYPSLALGCIDSSPKEVAGMFNIFANDGVFVQPHMIKWIKDQWGTKIYKEAPEKRRILPSIISGQVTKVLELGLKRVRKIVPQEWIKSQAISKTGTTNDSRTCWFVGSTPEHTTAVYMGRDDNQPLGNNVFPLRTAFPIWIGLHRETPISKLTFDYDPALHEVWIDEKTGALSNADDAITILI